MWSITDCFVSPKPLKVLPLSVFFANVLASPIAALTGASSVEFSVQLKSATRKIGTELLDRSAIPVSSLIFEIVNALDFVLASTLMWSK